MGKFASAVGKYYTETHHPRASIGNAFAFVISVIKAETPQAGLMAVSMVAAKKQRAAPLQRLDEYSFHFCGRSLRYGCIYGPHPRQGILRLSRHLHFGSYRYLPHQTEW